MPLGGEAGGPRQAPPCAAIFSADPAVQEAVACGCLPLVPDRLAYPEYFPQWCRYSSCPQDAEREVNELTGRLLRLAEAYRRGEMPTPPAIDGLGWSVQAARYATIMQAAAGR